MFVQIIKGKASDPAKFRKQTERWRDEVTRLTDDGMQVERIGAGLAFVRDPNTGFRIEVVSFKGRPFLDRILSGELGAECPLT